jgi:hypothetical protein
MEVLATLLSVLSRTLEIYSLILLVRVLLSWFPNMDWSNPVLSTVSSITDPYLNAFRGLIPPGYGQRECDGRSGLIRPGASGRLRAGGPAPRAEAHRLPLPGCERAH